MEDVRLKAQLGGMKEISETTIFRILHDHLDLTKVSPRWVQGMLMQPQKQPQRVECFRAALDLCNEDWDSVLSLIVIWGWNLSSSLSTWVQVQDSMQWDKKRTPPSNNFRVSQSAGKPFTEYCFLGLRKNRALAPDGFCEFELFVSRLGNIILKDSLKLCLGSISFEIIPRLEWSPLPSECKLRSASIHKLIYLRL